MPLEPTPVPPAPLLPHPLPRPGRRSAADSPASPASSRRKASRFTRNRSRTTSGSSCTTSRRTRLASAALSRKAPPRPARLSAVPRQVHRTPPPLQPELPRPTALRLPLPRRSLRREETQRVVAVLSGARSMQRTVVVRQRKSRGVLDDRQSRRFAFQGFERRPILVVFRIRRVDEDDVRIETSKVQSR